jgi:hypothetical protein
MIGKKPFQLSNEVKQASKTFGVAIKEPVK